MITLIFPPQWTPMNPPYSLCSIAGYLRHKSYKVNLLDLNIEFYDKILTPQYIEYAKEKALRDYEYLKANVLTNIRFKSSLKELDRASEKLLYMDEYFNGRMDEWNETSSLINEAVSVFKDPERYYEANVLTDAILIIENALRIISLPYYPQKLYFADFIHPHVPFKFEAIVKYCNSRKKNMFYEFYENAMPDILAKQSSIIGISINSSSQVLPGLTLGKMLKERGVSHVTIGGNYLGRVKDSLMKLPDFFKIFCHSLVMGEGEKTLLELMKALDEKKELSCVPSILYLKDGEVKYTFKGLPEKFNNLSYQDPGGLKLYKYFTPEIILCIQKSKGCYWKQCTFCDTDFGIHHDTKSTERLMGEIKYLKEKYNIRHFEFIDESIKPEDMKEMAERFIEENLHIRWFCNGRIEEGFTPEIFELLRKSGLTMFLWGFETGNDRIMRLINKGINIEKRYEILENSSDAGLWNFVYIFFGFPTETKEEAMDTVNAMWEHTDIIHSFGKSVFYLGKHTKLKDDGLKDGMVSIMIDDQELSSSMYCRPSSGMGDKELDEILEVCVKKAKEAYRMPLWMYLKYREHFHLYLVKYGPEYLKNYETKNWYDISDE